MRRLVLLSLVPLALACGEKEPGSDTGEANPVNDNDGDGVNEDDDCDDFDANNFPGNTEICDGFDNDCNGTVDEGVTTTFYADADRDGAGDPYTTIDECELPSGYVENSNDCDDDDDDNFPGNVEVCDGGDNDCDGLVDDDDDSLDLGSASAWYADVDGDGYGDADDRELACETPDGRVADDQDCDDGDDAQYPGADEYCNGEDDNCDGTVDEDASLDALTFYEDADSDGYGDPDSTHDACAVPDGYSDNDEDCDPADSAQFPGADEYCNDEDDDCDEDVDEDDAVDALTWYEDYDQDGYGDPDVTTAACEEPTGYVSNDEDCNDGDGDVNPDADEICDGQDNDCDSSTSEDGMVSSVSGSTYTDVTASLTGSSSSPASYTVTSDLAFCDGTFYVNLDVTSSVDLWSVNADASTAILDGAATGSVVSITTDGLTVGLYDLTLTNGSASYSDAWGYSGGGVQCESYTGTTIDLTLDGLVIDANEADTNYGYGGGISAYYCDLDISSTSFTDNTAYYYGGTINSWYSDVAIDGSSISGGDAIYGGAMLHIGGALTISDSDISDNVGTAYSTIYVSTSDAIDFDDVTVEDNTADRYAAGIFYGSGSFTWDGSTTGASTVIGNSGEGPALYLDDTLSFTATNVDFGTSSGGDDNDEYDLGTMDSYNYMAEDGASFTCSGGTCGTSSLSTLGGTTYSSNNTNNHWGDVFLASTNGTIDSFEAYTHPDDSACRINWYVMSNTSASTTGWTVEWRDLSNSTGSTSYKWHKTGVVGLPVESGKYYALVWGYDDYSGCSSTEASDSNFYFSSSGTTLTNLGSWTNYLYWDANTTYAVGDTVSASVVSPSYSTYRMYMNVYGTEL